MPSYVQVLVTLLLVACLTDAQLHSKPPVKPDIFNSAEELKSYIQDLNEYFAIVGRPRFGRSVYKRAMDTFRESLRLSALDAMDIDGDGLESPSEPEFLINYN